jgi:hypothetical protein
VTADSAEGVAGAECGAECGAGTDAAATAAVALGSSAPLGGGAPTAAGGPALSAARGAPHARQSASAGCASVPQREHDVVILPPLPYSRSGTCLHSAHAAVFPDSIAEALPKAGMHTVTSQQDAAPRACERLRRRLARRSRRGERLWDATGLPAPPGLHPHPGGPSVARDTCGARISRDATRRATAAALIESLVPGVDRVSLHGGRSTEIPTNGRVHRRRTARLSSAATWIPRYTHTSIL